MKPDVAPVLDPPPPAGAAPALGHPRALAAARICFGVIWLTDAAMKWSPQFTSGLLGDVQGQISGQPGVVKSWLRGWVSLLGHNPAAFAHLLGALETVLALALILGAFTNLACVGGALLSLLIWSTAESFGGPYAAGSTDVGASIVYVVVFGFVLASGAGGWASLDRRLHRRFGRLCARPVDGVPPPSPAFIGVAGALAALGLASGLLVAFADAPMPPGMVM